MFPDGTVAHQELKFQNLQLCKQLILNKLVF